MTNRRLGSGCGDASRVSVALFALMLLVSVRPSWGQEASIIGTVTDESGAVLPGVTVTASSPVLQVQQVSDVTNERGEYRISPLPIGTYAVDYALSGFQTVRREGVRLTVGFTARLDEVLKVGAVAETITVSGLSPVVDVASTASSTQLTRETLEASPLARSGYQALLAQAPGVRTNLDVGGNTTGINPSFKSFGQHGGSWSMVEGVLTTSPKSGTQGGNYFDYGAIEEATVQTSGTNADAATRGVQMNVILKSGGNDFHGTGYYTYTPGGLVSDNIDDELRAQNITAGNPVRARWDASGDVGGRIVPNKLWFYYSFRARGEDIDIVGNMKKPDGSPVDRTQSLAFSTEKVSYQPNSANRLIGFHQRNLIDYMNYVGTQFTPWESRTQALFTVDTFKGEWQLTQGNKFLSVQAGRWAWHVDYSGFSDLPWTIDQLLSTQSGNASLAGTISFEDRNHAKATLTWYKPDSFWGNHEIKTGFDYSDAHADRATLERGISGNYQLTYRGGAPFQMEAWNHPQKPDTRMRYLGIYAQDSWRIGRRLTLNLGVRYAHDNGFIREQCRVAAPAPFDQLYPAQCFEHIQFKVWNPIVPRLRAAYDVAGDGRTVIKGGWGRYAAMRYVDELQMANLNVPLTTAFRWSDLDNNQRFDVGESNLDVNGPDFISTGLAAGSNTLAYAVPNPDEREQMDDEFSLSVERELMPNFAIRATGLYTRTSNAYRVRNNLRPYDVYTIPVTAPDPGPDGVRGNNDDTGTLLTYYEYPTALAGIRFQEPTLANDSKADQSYKSFELAANKRLTSRWQLMASYSATRVNVPIVQNTSGISDFASPGLAPFVSTLDPNAEIFSENNTWEWVGRVSGSYQLPWDVGLSANFDHRSGVPFARMVSVAGGRTIPSMTVRVEPIGTRRTDSINLVDFRADKVFRLAGGHRFSFRVNMYNLFNNNTAVGVTQLSGPNFLRPTSIVPPRTTEFGVTYNF